MINTKWKGWEWMNLVQYPYWTDIWIYTCSFIHYAKFSIEIHIKFFNFQNSHFYRRIFTFFIFFFPTFFEINYIDIYFSLKIEFLECPHKIKILHTRSAALSWTFFFHSVVIHNIWTIYSRTISFLRKIFIPFSVLLWPQWNL